MNGASRAAIARRDHHLACGVAEGRREALAEVYQQHGCDVHALARELCGPGSADEVVHAVFFGWWREPRRFDPDNCSLREFLLIEVHRHATQPPRTDSATEGFGDGLTTRPLLAALPPDERQVIALACLGGFTYREIAEILDVPAVLAAGTITRGLERLSNRTSG